MRKIKKLLNLSDEGYKNFQQAVFACMMSNLALLLPFIVILQAISQLLDPMLTNNKLDVGKLWILFGSGIVAAVVYFFAYRNEYKKTYTAAYRESEQIRIEVAEHMRRLPLSFFNRKDLSELTTNIMGDCSSIEHTMSHVVPSMCGVILTAIIACLFLTLSDWRMALAIFATLPLAAGIILLSRSLQRKMGEKHVLAKMDVSRQVQEYLEGIKVVKAFGLAGEKNKALNKALKTMMHEAIRFESVTGVLVTMGMVILQVGIALVVFLGTRYVTDGTLGVLPFFTFLLISARIYAPLIVLLTLLPELFYMLVSTKRMQELRKQQPMLGDENIELESFDIDLRDVSFAYNKDDVIHEIKLVIPQNKVTALVGPSGSGKSTLVRLIARFWDVGQGEITIGGRNIRDMEPERLMSYMSFVFQDVVLFDDTVMNNIRLGRLGASDEEVYEAARMARCDEFIREMPQDYQTVIGENGCTLSGGERQRISIARALLKNAPIVLLDEATASLDPENEVQIQAAISELVKGRTVIIIAHRLRTIVDADQIAVLDGGRLVELGTGDVLIENGGMFASLYEIQQQSLGWTVSR